MAGRRHQLPGHQDRLDLNAANDGFLNGVAGKPGKLTNVAAGTGCAANGIPATKVFGV